MNYTVEVKLYSSAYYFKVSVLPQVENLVHNLSENANYSFRVLVSNSVGVVSTDNSQFCEFLSCYRLYNVLFLILHASKIKLISYNNNIIYI